MNRKLACVYIGLAVLNVSMASLLFYSAGKGESAAGKVPGNTAMLSSRTKEQPAFRFEETEYRNLGTKNIFKTIIDKPVKQVEVKVTPPPQPPKSLPWQITQLDMNTAGFKVNGTGEEFMLKVGDSYNIELRGQTFPVKLESVNLDTFSALLSVSGKTISIEMRF